MNVRRTNSECLSCGTQIPASLRRQTYTDLIVYECEKCGDCVLRGTVAEGLEGSTIPIPLPEEQTRVLLPTSVDVGTWEVWWTTDESISIIHDRHVNGRKEMYDFVRTIQSIYDS